jgi:hypothetical protein
MDADTVSDFIVPVVLASVLIASTVVSSIYAEYRLRKNVEFESRRQYFALSFPQAKRYRIVQEEGNDCVFNVFDVDGEIVFRFIYVNAKWWTRLWSEMWMLKDFQGTDIAMCLRSRTEWRRSKVVFYLRDLTRLQLSSNAVPGSALSMDDLSPQSVSAPLPQSDLFAITPYVDASLTANIFVSRDDLGPTQEMPLPIDLLSYEPRRMHKISLVTKAIWCQSSFKIMRKTMMYMWKANGYLEKYMKFETDPTSVRVAFIRRTGIATDGKEFTLYINRAMIDEFSALSTAFLSVQSGLWKKQRPGFD